MALPVTALFDFPTVTSLAGYIHTLVAPSSGIPTDDIDVAAIEARNNLGQADNRPSVRTTAVSVAGRSSSGLLVGTLSADGIRRAPLNRWVADDSSLDGSDLIVFGGFLDDAELFDVSLFSVNASEAVLLDPQQRLLLHFSWDALSGSGMDLTSLAALGVYVGISGSDYGRLAARHSLALSPFAGNEGGLEDRYLLV